MIPQVGEKVVYHHPGLKSGPAPGFAGLQVMEEYIIIGIRKLEGQLWVQLVDSKGSKIKFAYRYDIFG